MLGAARLGRANRTARSACASQAPGSRLQAQVGQRLRRHVPGRECRCSDAAVAPYPSPAPDEDEDDEDESLIASIATNALAGITTSLSMVPEALAFSLVVGLSPVAGLQTAAVMAIMAAIFGGQPGSISGAAGATAVVLTPLTASLGTEYLFATVMLAGVFQILASIARLGKYIRLVPQPVMLGFINGLALLFAVAQLDNFKVAGGAWMQGAELTTMLALTAASMAIVTLWERLTDAIPGPLVAIVALTAGVAYTGISTTTVGDLATISGSLPMPHIPQVPLNLATLTAIVPVALSVASVGLISTLLVQQLVDEVLEGRTPTHVECRAQGLAQIASGLLGGMGGCALVGQSLINVNAGGTSRVSGLTCGAALLAFILFGAPIIQRIPIGALTGVVLVLVIEIFDFTSFARLNQVPPMDAVVLVTVTAVTYATNLAIAVLSGVVIASLSFAWQSAVRGVSAVQVWDGDTLVYRLRGPVFFGSIQSFKDTMRSAVPNMPDGEPMRRRLVLDFMECRVWDGSALDVINSEAARLQEDGWDVRLRHLSKDCRQLLERAGDMVELDVMEDDPRYGLLSNYDSIVRNRGTMRRVGSRLRGPSSRLPRRRSPPPK